MSYRRHNSEFGELIDVHRPARPWIGWVISVLFALPFGLMLGLGPPGPIAGVILLLAICLPLLYGLGEWFFLEQRLYEHGIVLPSIRFVGLHPKRAHKLAKGKLDWPATTPGDMSGPAPMPVMNWWWVSYRDSDQNLRLIADAVRRSQQTRPHQEQAR